jgi:hypothetical protein
MINFPVTPTIGQSFTDPTSHLQWVWDGTKWVATGIVGAPFLPLSGGTMTGLLTANSPGISAPQAIGDNRIINGGMWLDQRNQGASGTANNVYTIDRWIYSASQSTYGGWGRSANSAAGQAACGFGYFLSFLSSSAAVPAAADFCQFVQIIEADMVWDFAWGTPQAQPVTLSFWFVASLTGTFSGSLRNYAGTRSFPFTFSIPTASVWTKIAITIPGDAAGAWVLQGSAGSMVVGFDLGSGANSRGPAGAWAASSFIGVTGAQSIIAVNGASVGITGVKLEIGSLATPFNRQTIAKTVADCQRYYWSVSNYLIGLTTANTGWSSQPTVPFPVQMRVTPTISNLSFSASSGPAGTPAVYTTNLLVATLFNSGSNWSQGAGAATIAATAQFGAEI